MLHPSRAHCSARCLRFRGHRVFVSQRPGSRWLAPAALALAFGCSPAAPPPRAADDAAAPSSEVNSTPAEASPEQSPAAPTSPEPAIEPPAATPAPSGAARAPRDTRGKHEIQQVMADNRDKVRACYDAALAKNPGIAGDLVVDFTIDPGGAVKQAEVNWSQSDIHIPELDTCAADAVRSLTFPASSRGLESKVSFPFNFNPPRPNPPARKSSEQ